MLNLPTFTTKATDALNREIAKRSHGVCFLGFSRGKDAICAWLNLKKYFTKIIPFHCCNIPDLDVVNESLAYYDYEFDTHIIRMAEGGINEMVRRMIYQFPEEEGIIDDSGLCNFNKVDVLDYLRYKLSLPNAWCAFGINACDSMERRCICQGCNGMHKDGKTFYPTWDWPREKIIQCVRDSGVKLPDDYNYFQGTITGDAQWFLINAMKKHYPREFAKLKDWLPLCEAELARQDFRREMYPSQKKSNEKGDCDGKK